MGTKTSGHWIALTAADGHRLDAFAVAPAASAKGTVVVLPEIFGVNGHIQSVATDLARLGYAAIAPALFDRVQKNVNLGYDQDGVAQGIRLKSAVSVEHAMLDVAAALAHAGEARSAVVLGFCWGGTLAWLSAARLPVRAAVAYYGGQIGSFIDVELRAPVMTHFGEQDHSIPVTVYESVAREHPQVLNHLYPAGHGFNCSERASYHADSAPKAWSRSVAFLQAAL